MCWGRLIQAEQPAPGTAQPIPMDAGRLADTLKRLVQEQPLPEAALSVPADRLG